MKAGNPLFPSVTGFFNWNDYPVTEQKEVFFDYANAQNPVLIAPYPGHGVRHKRRDLKSVIYIFALLHR